MIRKFTLILLFLAAVNCIAQGQRYKGCLDSLSIASVYTPNGDAVVDGWGIDFPCQPDEFNITVYTRWGNEVYTSKNPAFRFYFTDKDNKPLGEGVYFYIVDLLYMSEEKQFKGNVTKY